MGLNLFGSKQEQGSQAGYDLGMPGFSQRDTARNFAQQSSDQIQQNLENVANQRKLLGVMQGQAESTSPNLTKVNLNTEFQGPQFGTGLDARGQNLLALEQANRKAQQVATQNQIASQFKNNPRLAAILGMQNSAQNQLNNNPLAFQAAEARNAQMINENAATNSAQNMTNQARLGQAGFNNQTDLQKQASQLQAINAAANLGQQQLQTGQLGLSQALAGLDVYGKKTQNTQNRTYANDPAGRILGK